jgi:hypothetical protein
MKHLINTDAFFKYDSLLETINVTADDVWATLNSFTLPEPRVLSIQEQLAIDAHQSFMLENFETIEEINQRETLLYRYGYAPAMLTLEGAYFETLDSIEIISEGVLDSIKSFLSMMTEGGSSIGILQFALDLLGIIPFDWAGLPINEVANIINALIYFYRDNFLLGAISLGMAIPGVGSVLFGPIKFAVRPFTSIAGKMFGAMFKGESAAIRAAAAELRAAPGSKSLVDQLGKALKPFAEFCSGTAATVISKLSKFIAAAIEKLSFGKLKMPSSALKWVDDLVAKLQNLSNGAKEAGEFLLREEGKVAKSAAELSASGEKAAELAAKQGKTGVALSDEVAKKFKDVPGFSKQLQNEIMQSAGFKKLAGASAEVQETYIKNELTRKLIDQILKQSGKGGSKSLLQVLSSPEMVKVLSKSTKFKGLDKILLDAVATGDTAAIKSVMELAASNPAIMKMVSPRVAKTMAIFREAPDFLLKGRKVVSSAVDAASSLPKVKMPWGLSFHTRNSAKNLIGFILKSLVRSNECAMYIGTGSPSEVYDKTVELATDSAASGLDINTSIKEALLQIQRIFEDADLGLSAEAASDLKQNSPEVYQILQDQLKEQDKTIDELVQVTTPKNPCTAEAAVALAKTGTILAKGLQGGTYKAKGKGDVYNIFDEEAGKGLLDASKAALKAVGEDPNIDAQHPLADASPYMKAYFSDVYDFDDAVYVPVQDGKSRLDPTLDKMVKTGEITSAEKEKIKTETLDHWKNDTAPEELTKKVEPIEVNESIFKIGRVNLV